MTNNTINNVPRELLEVIEQTWRIHYKGGPATTDIAADAIEKGLGQLRALLSAPSPAGVDGLKRYEVFPYLDDEVAEMDICESDDGTFVKYADATAIIDGLRGEVADLHTTMMAAAVEIQEHWAAHCDEEGYGPANLMHRLERGIASQYGYSAETLVRLESQRDQQAQRIGELEVLLRACHSALYPFDNKALEREIEAALSAGKEVE